LDVVSLSLVPYALLEGWSLSATALNIASSDAKIAIILNWINTASFLSSKSLTFLISSPDLSVSPEMHEVKNLVIEMHETGIELATILQVLEKGGTSLTSTQICAICKPKRTRKPSGEWREL
jgi:hypothetical protein